jgi:ribosomal protein L18
MIQASIPLSRYHPYQRYKGFNEGKGGNKEGATIVGKLIAQKALKKA